MNTSLVIFSMLFFSLVNWMTIKVFFKTFLEPRKRMEDLEDNKILTYLQQKTGERYTLKLIDSPTLWAAATRLPIKPVIYISSKVYKTFTWNELEWILLHESGHCVFWHTYLIIALQLLFWVIGFSVISFLSLPLPSIPFPTIGLGILYFQFNRELVEKMADKYAIKHIRDPLGMISANITMKKVVTSILYKNKLLGILFTVHPSYDWRIEIAQREILKRKDTS